MARGYKDVDLINESGGTEGDMFDRLTAPLYTGPCMSGSRLDSGGRFIYAACFLMAVLVFRPAYAQDSQNSGQNPDPSFGASQSADLTIDAESIPNKEKTNQTEQMLSDQRSTLGHAAEVLAAARSAKDIVQLSCVNDKLTQVKGLLKISEVASLQMYEAIAEARQDIVNYEYTKIVLAYEKSKVLRSEIDRCNGQDSVHSSDVELDVDVDGSDSGSGGGGSGGGGGSAAAPPPGPALPPVASSS